MPLYVTVQFYKTRMFPRTCKNSTTYLKVDFVLRNKTSKTNNLGWWSTGDQYESIINHSNKPLSPGDYSIDVTVTYSIVDTYKEYTVGIYAPKKVRIFNSKNVENERGNTTHNITFQANDCRPD
jgi:hypothetical protein